jgi:hypothetical protein
MRVVMTEGDYIYRKKMLLSRISEGNIECKNDCLGEKCKACKGRCCETYPCILSPTEFIDINNIDYMKSVLDTGVLAIAPMNMADSFYCIRPRGVKDLDTVTTGYVVGENNCILQSKKGCVLDYLTRPSEGLLLIPGPSIKCFQLYTEEKIVNDWYNYQHLLSELRKYYKNKEIPKPEATEETARIYKLKLLSNNCKKETN